MELTRYIRQYITIKMKPSRYDHQDVTVNISLVWCLILLQIAEDAARTNRRCLGSGVNAAGNPRYVVAVNEKVPRKSWGQGRNFEFRCSQDRSPASRSGIQSAFRFLLLIAERENIYILFKYVSASYGHRDIVNLKRSGIYRDIVVCFEGGVRSILGFLQ